MVPVEIKQSDDREVRGLVAAETEKRYSHMRREVRLARANVRRVRPSQKIHSGRGMSENWTRRCCDTTFGYPFAISRSIGSRMLRRSFCSKSQTKNGINCVAKSLAQFFGTLINAKSVSLDTDIATEIRQDCTAYALRTEPTEDKVIASSMPITCTTPQRSTTLPNGAKPPKFSRGGVTPLNIRRCVT